MPYFKHPHSVGLVYYHSINEYREDRIRVPNIVTPTAFEAQIQYLASIAKVIPIQEYLDHIKKKEPLPQKSIVITFDDGYKDNLTIASPILQKYGVPATFFISTGYIGTGKMKWEDQLSCLIRRSKVDVISLGLQARYISFNIGSEKDKFRAINMLVNILGYLTQSERESVLDELAKQLKVKCTDQVDVMMTWDDVRKLADTPGFSIGSHTVTHQHLTRISLDNVKWEVTNSKEHIEREIGRAVTLFSYPKGDFNKDVIAAVQSAGYTSAGTIEYGQNNIYSDPFRLKRVIALNQRGVRFSIGMWLRTSPLGELLRRGYNILISVNRSGVNYQQG